MDEMLARVGRASRATLRKPVQAAGQSPGAQRLGADRVPDCGDGVQ